MLRAVSKPSIIKAELQTLNLKKFSIKLTPLKHLSYIYNNINSKFLYILRLYKV